MVMNIFFYLDRKKSHGMYLTEAFLPPEVQLNDLNIMVLVVVLVWVLFGVVLLQYFLYLHSAKCK